VFSSAWTLGGWLTANYGWRYIFCINLPVGLLAFFGMTTFLKDTVQNTTAKLDWFGFGALSLAIGALQVLLDRGEELDWFSSGEIVIEAIIGAAALYLFLAHIFTARAPFVRPSLFRNRNFAAGALFGVVIGLTYYASLALQPPFLQNLMNYPIASAGLVMAPRGLGTMGAMLIAGRLAGRVDTRLMLAIGLGLTAWSFSTMTGWTPDVSRAVLEPRDGGWARRARRRRHAPGPDHRLHRRLQAAADRDARGSPAASRLQEAVGRRGRHSHDRGGIMRGFKLGQARDIVDSLAKVRGPTVGRTFNRWKTRSAQRKRSVTMDCQIRIHHARYREHLS